MRDADSTMEAPQQSEEATHHLIREIERERLRSLVVPDLQLAERLHSDDYELITPGGGTISKREYLDAIASGQVRYIAFDPVSEVRVRAYGGAAIARYRVRIEGLFGGEPDSGEFWHTDAYELRAAGWQAVWSQATRIPARSVGARHRAVAR